MLDTYGRKYATPLIQKCAQLCIQLGMKPDQVTLLGFMIGLLPILCLFFSKSGLAICFLWLSGLLDAVDGAMARRLGETSEWGAFMDICLDRVVEVGIILMLGWQHPSARFSMMLLITSILLSMTVFLTSGALFKQKKEKAFYYQAGLAERTEGFLFLTLMMLWQQHLELIVYLFSLAIMVTVIQRVYEAYSVLKK